MRCWVAVVIFCHPAMQIPERSDDGKIIALYHVGLVGRCISMHTLHEISGCLLRLSVMHPCCQVAIVTWTHFCDQTRHLFVCFYQIHNEG